MARTENSITFLRSEYKAPAFTIQTVDLDIAPKPQNPKTPKPHPHE